MADKISTRKFIGKGKICPTSIASEIIRHASFLTIQHLESLVNKILCPIATAMLLLPTLSAFAEDAPLVSEIKQEITIDNGGVITTTTTENGVTSPPVVSVAPVGEGLKIASALGGTATVDGGIIVNDTNSPVDQEKIRALIQKNLETVAPKLRQRMAEQQAADFSELSKVLGMSGDEFDAIKPLLATVENLRKQKSLIDNPASSMMGGASGRGTRGLNNFFNPQMLLGDTQLDPTVAGIQEAAKALKALVDDKQANATELTSAVNRLRKSRDDFTSVLNKAQNDLRAVLTSSQEALLVVRGTLD
jgi:hypothetical protein